MYAHTLCICIIYHQFICVQVTAPRWWSSSNRVIRKGWLHDTTNCVGGWCRDVYTRGIHGNGTETVSRGHRIVGYWLLGCCGMVAGSVVIG